MAQDAAETSAAADAGIQEIVVTARKRAESITDVPLAIAAITETELARAGIEDLSDIAAATPGLSFQSFNGGALGSPVIRGMSQTDIASANNNVGVFLDGVYISGKNNIDLTLLDLARVEVIKGPQSALYGRNTFSGAINYVTKPAADELEGSVRATFGSDDLYEGRASISAPLVQDILSARLAIGYSSFDGTLDNGFGYENLGGWDRKLGSALSFRFTPTEEFTATLFGYHGEQELDPTAAYIPTNTCGVPTTATFTPAPRGGAAGTYYCGELRFQDEWFVSQNARNSEFETDFAYLNLEYDFGPVLGTAVGSWGKYDYDGLSDQLYTNTVDNSTTRRFTEPFTGPAKDASAELRLQSNGDSRLRWLTGLYWFNSEFRQFARSFSAATPLVAGVGFAFTRQTLDTVEYAAFGSLEFDFTDRLAGSIEGRYNEEEITLYSGPLTSSPVVARYNDTFYAFTPRVTLDYKLTDASRVYVSYAEGTKSGGFNGTTFVPEITYSPEENQTYEIGYKTELANRTRIEVAAFYIDWRDVQLPSPSQAPVPPGGQIRNVVRNVGEAEVFGLEGQITGAIGTAFDYRFAATWTQPEWVDGTIDFGSGTACPAGSSGCSTDVSGNRVPRTAEWQVATSGTYTFALADAEIYVRGDLSYESEKFTRSLNVQSYNDRALFDARVGWVRDGLEVSLWSKNLFDEEYIASSINEPEFGRTPTSTFTTAIPGNTRTFGLTANYNF